MRGTFLFSGVSWEYGNPPVAPDYFLLTYCAKSKCTSQNAPGEDRSVILGKLGGSLVYDVTIQAVRLRDGQIYASPTEMTSFVAPDFDLSANTTVNFEDITDSPTVRVKTSNRQTLQSL